MNITMRHTIVFFSRKSLAVISIFMSAMTICLALPNGVSHEHYTLDVFRSTRITAEAVDKEYGKQLEDVATKMLSVNEMPTEKNSHGIQKPLSDVIEGIYKKYKKSDVAYLALTPVVYPGGSKIGFTLDIVEKNDIKRMQGMLPKKTASLPDPDHLIRDWLSYEKISFDKFFRTRVAPPVKYCPAFHCIFGFEDPDFKSYGDKFNREVPKYKKELIAILYHDKDDLKRGAAAFLLAHLKNGNEVIHVLAPSMRDDSSHVRNNVMRVLAQAVLKVKGEKFPMAEVIRALQYPSTVDRNKALYLLTSLSLQPSYAKYLREHGCDALLDQFRLLQPNLHDESYIVLKQISHETYPDTDIKAWDAWAAKHCGHRASV